MEQQANNKEQKTNNKKQITWNRCSVIWRLMGSGKSDGTEKDKCGKEYERQAAPYMACTLKILIPPGLQYQCFSIIIQNFKSSRHIISHPTTPHHTTQKYTTSKLVGARTC